MKPTYLFKIQVRRANTGINNQNTFRQLFPVLEITFDQSSPGLPKRLRNPSISISRQIDKEKSFVNSEKIKLLGSSWRSTGSGQSFLTQETIDQA